MRITHETPRVAALLIALVLLPGRAIAFTWPWESGPWPSSSNQPVRALDHPTVETKVATLVPGVESGYRFIVFGDQRALADGEWQAMMTRIATLAASEERLLFMLDTGDIVQDGSHSDQFEMLKGILSPASELPYLVGVGNHEVHNNRPGPARENTATFLGYLDRDFSADRMYYRKDIGPIRFLFLDSNDLVYGEDGKGGIEDRPGSRTSAQLAWLSRELADTSGTFIRTVAVIHHPVLQSSSKHRPVARALWDTTVEDRRLPDALADGGVDLILTGHTHTHERFRLTRRSDGHRMYLINFSGRPRTSFLWIGDGARRAQNIAGRETGWLIDKGWSGIDEWEIIQEDAMVEDDANQFGVVTIGPDGSIDLVVHYLDEDAPGGLRAGGAVELLPAVPAGRR